jgi:hypothetical protein
MKKTGKISIWAVIILIAVLAVMMAEGVLIWRLLDFAKKDVLLLKGTAEQQATQYEQQAAEYVLDKFMESRINRQQDQSLIYLTENAMDQYSKAEFDLINNFKSFEVLKSEKLGETKFRFIVRIKQEDDINEIVEAVRITKILDRYYVDSVEIAG